jgi:hypothetical protein
VGGLNFEFFNKNFKNRRNKKKKTFAHDEEKKRVEITQNRTQGMSDTGNMQTDNWVALELEHRRQFGGVFFVLFF